MRTVTEGHRCFLECNCARHRGVHFLFMRYWTCGYAEVCKFAICTQQGHISFTFPNRLFASITIFWLAYFLSLGNGDEWSQVAYVTFEDAQGAETSLLISVNNWRRWYDSVGLLQSSFSNCHNIIFFDPWPTSELCLTLLPHLDAKCLSDYLVLYAFHFNESI